MEKKKLLEKFAEFCRSLGENDNIAIVHHNDADGVCSAAITAKAVFGLAKKKPGFVSTLNYGEFEKERLVIEECQKIGINKMIFVDLSIDSQKGFLEKIQFLDSLLVIDHHEFQRDLNSEKIIFINAKFFSKKPSAYPASKLCFDLFSKLIDLKESAWIACAGIIGDNAGKKWRAFIERTIKENKTSVSEIEKLERIISAVSVMQQEKTRQMFWAIFGAKKIGDCFKKEFLDIEEEFQKEKSALMGKMLESEECIPELDLLIYKIETGFPAIKSYLINDLSNKMPKKTLIVVEFSKNRVRFSGRRQNGKIKINEVLQKAVHGIPNSNAGGHIPAAGGNIPKKFFKQFEQQLIKELQRIKAGEKNGKQKGKLG